MSGLNWFQTIFLDNKQLYNYLYERKGVTHFDKPTKSYHLTIPLTLMEI